MSAQVYPVHVDAQLDSGLSRWLWLVKWVLAIPHYFVLAFLWVAFAVLSVVAFFAILFTGRYPRAVFDFNVGVLRWTWRVAYYAYGALATDRYPPFTLNEVPDYPAHFSVDYPEHLSRGLVLVKWWLLAIPHYIVVGLLVGGGAYAGWGLAHDNRQLVWSGGLIGILVAVAAVVLLFTGGYPRQIFDLVLGLNRWVLRVAAYAGLMTDDYPPFRLDMGGADPSVARVQPPPAPPSGTSASAGPPPPATGATPPAGGATAPAGGATAPTSRWGAGRVIAVVLAVLVFLLGTGLVAGGTALAVARQTVRNDQGYYMSAAQSLSTPTYAVTSMPFTIQTSAAASNVPHDLLGDVLLRARSTGGRDVFIGVAPQAQVSAYLAGVEHATLVDLRGTGGGRTPVYQDSSGGAPRSLPTQARFWTASASGPGAQQLVWTPRSGNWAMVLMNADGSRNVAADVSIGATVPVLGGVMVGLLIAGGLLMLIGLGVLLTAVLTVRRPAQ